jgi:hypothetical protein
MPEFPTEYRAKTLRHQVSASINGVLSIACIYGILSLTHVIGDEPPGPGGLDLGEALLLGAVAAYVVPKSALACYQVLGRREPFIRICREGLEVRLVGRSGLDDLPRFLEWITLYWSLLSLQGFRTKRLRLAWSDIEDIRLAGRPSVRVLVIRGPFRSARQDMAAADPPAADRARFDQQDFAVPMDEIAAAINHFRVDEKERGFLRSWHEPS